MSEFVKAAAAFFLQMSVFFLFGRLLMSLLRLKKDASLALVLGYLLYFALFEVMAVPMTLLWVPLNGLCIVWGILLALLSGTAVFGMVRGRRKETGRQKYRRKVYTYLSGHSFWIIPAAAAVLLQCAFGALYQDTTVDAAYYVGMTSTSLYTGTLGRYSPYTGALMKYFQGRYVFSAYPMHNAVWCRFLSIHPLVQAKTVMCVINVLMANLIVYQIGKQLFQGEKRKADLMVCLVCVMQLFSYTIYSPGTFLFTRGYEGKALLANVIFPMVLYCSLWIYQDAAGRGAYAALFLVSLSAACFSGSSVILPAAAAAGVLPVLFLRRQFSRLVPFSLSMVPSVVYAGLYFGTQLGWIAFAAS